MPSRNKTPNIGLNQWEGNEYAKRQDFVDDNIIIDTEIKDLKDGIEDALNLAQQAFQSASDGRTVIASSITAKGVHASKEDTFPTLANKIGLIETDPSRGTTNAVASDVLSGKKAISQGSLITGTIPSKGAATITPTTSNQTIAAGQYLSGVQTIAGVTVPVANVLAGITIAGALGTMPNRAGDNNALAIYRVGTILKFRAPNGYFDGVDDTVQYSSVDWLASNILKDKNVFGLVGTLELPLPAKKTASGVYTLTTGQIVTISGLDFLPSKIIIAVPGNVAAHTLYFKDVEENHYSEGGSRIPVSIGGSTGKYINSTGFNLGIAAVYTGSKVVWWAEE